MVSSEEASKNLTPEERLKALLFQYSKLYARWSEDREVFNKGMADQEEVLKNFTQKLKKLEEQISCFEELEPHVRQKLVDTVKNSISAMVDSINGKIGNSVTFAIDKTVKKLEEEIEEICRAVRVHRQEMQGSQLKTFLVMMCASIVSSLLIVWLLIPKPIMPLSSQDMNTYLQGLDIQGLWPKLSRKTQIEIDESAKRHFGVAHPFGALTSNDENSGGQSDSNG